MFHTTTDKQQYYSTHCWLEGIAVSAHMYVSGCWQKLNREHQTAANTAVLLVQYSSSMYNYAYTKRYGVISHDTHLFWRADCLAKVSRTTDKCKSMIPSTAALLQFVMHLLLWKKTTWYSVFNSVYLVYILYIQHFQTSPVTENPSRTPFGFWCVQQRPVVL